MTARPRGLAMHPPTQRYLVACVALFALTAVLVGRSGRLTMHPDFPLRLELPDHVGAYTAEDVRFCHNLKCLRAWPVERHLELHHRHSHRVDIYLHGSAQGH